MAVHVPQTRLQSKPSSEGRVLLSNDADNVKWCGGQFSMEEEEDV